MNNETIQDVLVLAVLFAFALWALYRSRYREVILWCAFVVVGVAILGSVILLWAGLFRAAGFVGGMLVLIWLTVWIKN